MENFTLHSPAFGMRIPAVKRYAYFALMLTLLLLAGIRSNAQYTTIPVTGFNADVIANGSTYAGSVSADVDGGGYDFLDSSYTFSGAIAHALPTSGLISSIASAGLKFQLASASANNSLQLRTQNASGALSFVTPVTAGTIYVLATSGSGTSTVNMTVKFTDSTSQLFSAQSISDWYDGSVAAVQGIGRIDGSGGFDNGGGATNPRLYQIALPLTASNYTKSIAYIAFTKTNATGTGFPQVMGISVLAPCVAPATQPTALTFTPTTSQIGGSFTAATGNDGYLVVRYSNGATPVAPVNGTTYTTASAAFGTGKVLSVGTATNFTDVGLTPGTSYTYYVYAYSSICAGGPVYNTTTPLTATQATLTCTGTLSGVIPVGPTAPASPAGFPTLTAAVAYVSNGLAGPTVFELQSDYTSASETFPIAFSTNPCISAGKSLTIRPAASATGLVITSSNAGATIDLNGAKYVIFDGRPGGTGTTSQLSIINTNAGGVAARFTNDASHNKVTYIDLQGQNTSNTSSALSGVVYFGTASSITAAGNDYDTLSYCNIHATTGGNPVIGICSYGTTAPDSSYNDYGVITNCNIYDFFGASLASTGVKLDQGSNAWTISNNSVYQTATRTYTGTSITHRGFWITPNTGGITTTASGFVITGNYIGGSSPNAGGTPYTTTGGTTLFTGMDISVGAGTPTQITGNKVTNFAITSNYTSTGIFTGIGIANGNNFVGAAGAGNGNTIGASIGTSAIAITANSSGSTTYGIKVGSGNSVIVVNDTVGAISITGAAAATYASLNGIAATGGTGTSLVVTGNTIANLTNLSSIATSTTSGQLAGINISAGLPAPSITANTIHDLTNYSVSTSTGNTAPLIGIIINSTACANGIIAGNNIYNLAFATTSTSNTLALNGWGIVVNASTSGATTINNNLIHSLDFPNWAATAPSAVPVLGGITANSGAANIYNNMIRLGINSSGTAVTKPIQFIGINKNNAQNNNIWYNSVYIGGTGVASSTGNAHTYAFQRATTGVDSIKNNIFVNVRSNGAATTPKHYAIRLNAITSLNIDNNDYYVSPTGTGSVLAVNNATDITALTALQAATALDFSSVSVDPLFNNPTGTTATLNLHINAGTTPIAIAAAGTAVSIKTDYDGDARPGPVGSANGGTAAPDMGADEFDGVPTITCFPPSGLKVDSILTTVVRLSWTAPTPAPASGYQVYYGPSPLAAPTATTTPSVTVTTTTAIDSVLTAGTTYQYYVRSACSGTSNSNWTGPYTFSTACSVISTFPYTESFTTSSLPVCWNASEGASGATYHWRTGTSDVNYGVAGPQSGSYFAYLPVINASTSYNPYYLNTTTYVLPSVPKRLRYFYYLGNGGYKGTTGAIGSDPYPMTIQISTDGGSTWSDIYNHTSTNSIMATTNAVTNWQQNTVDLTPYANKIIKLRVKSNSNTGCCTAYDQGIDEFTVEDVPACGQITANTLSASAITTTSATVSWGKILPTPASYEVYYSTSNTLPTSGPVTPNIVGIVDSFVNITGLQPSSTYYVWVRSNCGGANAGGWTFTPLAVSTLCAATTVFPYVQAFGTTGVPNCWTASEGSSGASTHWSATGSDAANGVSGAAVGSGFAFLDVYNAQQGYNPYYLTTYTYTLPATPKQLSYYYYLGTGGFHGKSAFTYVPNNGNDPYPLSLQISTDGGTTWNTLYSHSDTNSFFAPNGATSNWNLKSLYLDAYVNQTVTFRFISYSNYGFGFTNQGVDEFSITDIPACTQPMTLFPATNVSATGAKLYWSKPRNLPSTYDVYYSTVNTAPTSTTTPTVTGITDTLTTISGLSATTTYFAWVRSNCGGGSASVWTGPITFTTPCASISTFPYLQSFSNFSIPNCWSSTAGAGSFYFWGVSTSDFYGASAAPAQSVGTNFAYLGSASTTYNPYYLTTQSFTLTGAVKQVAYYYFIGTNNYKGTTGATGSDPYPLTLQISADGGTTWTDLYNHTSANSTFATASSGGWYSNTVYLPTYAGQTVTFRFKAISNSAFTSGTSGIDMDEFAVNDAPTCVAPTNLVAAPIGTNTATITWTAPIFTTPASYDLYYSTDSTSPTSTTTPNFSGITGTSKGLTGLYSATQYYVWVRSNCGTTNGTSAWTPTGFNFTTACDAYAIPLTQGFNFTFAPDCWSQQYVALSVPGTNDLQYRQGSSTNPATTPYEGLGYIYFNSNSFGSGTETRLVSPPLYTVGTPSVSIQFHMYNENNASYNFGNYLTEGITVQYSVDGTTWNDVQFYSRNDAALAAGTGQWELKTLTLPAAVGGKSFVYIGFKFHSAHGDNMSLDMVQIFPTTSLPVTLISFTGAKQGSSDVLSWSTANEINNKGFELQRSADGISFSDLAFIDSKAVNGNSTSNLSYEYTDNSPLTGNNYYRLKQVDKNGKETYSSVVLLTRTVKNVQIVSIAPNIVTNETTLNLVTGKEGNVSIRVVDAIGRVLSVKTQYLNNGNNNILLNLGYLSAGMYNLQVIDEDTVVSQRFIKK